MKKSLVAVGVIVALGVIWSGSAWYTGKQLETRLDEMLAQANAQLQRAAPQAGLTLIYQNYHRGWFSSQLQVVATPKPGAVNGYLKPGDSIVLNEQVDHGPFPLMSLKKFNLLPALGAIATTLEQTPASSPLFTAAGDKQPFELQTRIGYGGATDSSLVVNPLDLTFPQGKLNVGHGEFTVNADNQQDDISFSGQLESLLYGTINQYGQQVQLTATNLVADGDTTQSKFVERVGKQNISADKVAVAIEGKEMALMEGVKIAGNSAVESDGKHVGGQFDYSLDSLKMQNRDLGSGKLHINVKSLDGEALHQFSQALQQQQQAIMNDPALANNPALQQQKSVEAVKQNLPLLLKGNPVVNIAPLSWKNARGEATFNLALALKDPAAQPVAADNVPNDVDRVINSLDAQLNIPLDVASELMTQVAQLEGYQQDDAAKLAEQQVKGVSAMGQMFQITTEKDGAIATHLKYANGQVNINGRTMALDEFINKYTLPAGIIPDSPAPTLPQ